MFSITTLTPIQTLLVLLKCEPFFIIGFATSYGFVNVHYEVPEFPITMCLVPLMFLVSALALYAIEHERVKLACIAIVSRLIAHVLATWNHQLIK